MAKRTTIIRTPSLRALDLFVNLMRTRSLTNTAQRTGITQPAVSLALKELEAQTGLPLFVRVSQRIVPTPQADALLPYAERLIAQADLVQQRIVSLQDTSRTTLRLACIPSFGSTLLPKAISEFQRQKPSVQIKIDVQHLANVLDLVRQEAVDIGFAYLSETEDRDEDQLLTVQLACLMSPDHPLAKKKIITLDDLSHHTAIVATKGYIPIPPSILDTLQKSDRLDGRGVMEVNNVYTAMAFAQQGIGVTLSNPLLLLNIHAHGLVGRPFEPSFSLALGILRTLLNERTPVTSALIAQVRAAAHEGVQHLKSLGMKAKAF